MKESAGNVEHGGDLAAFFDADLRLTGTARDMYLGTQGAELA